MALGKHLTSIIINVYVNTSEMLGKVAVTVDGTWQRRGHVSKNGVVFVLSVLTGKVLDFEVKTLFCHQCAKAKSQLSDAEFSEWYKLHESDCSINHTGSSDQMETEGAIAIFLRSINMHKLKYTTFVGDGDSSCYGNVAAACAAEYDDKYIVIKEECVGHVQKRMGSRLREYKRKMQRQKLSDGLGVGGIGRLTDKQIDKIQNFYGQCIRNHIGDSSGMKDSIWAIYCHMIKDSENSLQEQHRLCPKGSDSWCKFWSNRDEYHEKHRLPCAFLPELEPIFTALTDDVLLQRCLQGLTQNQNEAINHILWSNCPKTKFVGITRLHLAVCNTVGHFNSGSCNKAAILESIGVSIGPNSLAGFRKENKTRLDNAERKVSMKVRRARRKLRGEKKAKAGSKKKTTYHPGAFGLSVDPDFDIGQEKSSKKATTKRKLSVKENTNRDKNNKISATKKLPLEIRFVGDNEVKMIKMIKL